MGIEQNNGRITKLWNKNFICVLLANFLLCLSHFTVNPLVASYTTHLGAGVGLMGILTGMFFGISFLLRPVTGPLITWLDKRMLLIVVFVIGMIASLGYAVFHSLAAFVAFRFLSGVQYSLVGSLIMTLAAANLPEERMASGLGIYGVGGAVATAIAPSVGISLLDLGTKLRNDVDFGFTLVFLFAAVVFAIAIIPSVILSPDRVSKEEKKITGAWYKNIVTVHAIPVTASIMFAVVGHSLYNSYMVEFAKEQGIAGISAFYTVLALGLIASRAFSGRLADKLGLSKVIIPALLLYAVSFFVIGSSKSLPSLLIATVVAAIGYGSAQPAMQAMAIQSVEPAKRSVASNTLYVGLDLGLFLGPVLGGFIYERSSFATMFKLAPIIILISLGLFLVALPSFKKRLELLSEHH